MTARLKIVIAGGGMAGLAVAALLNRARHAEALDVTLIDAGPRPVFLPDDDVGLRVSAISPGSEALLEQAGAWTHVTAARHSSYEHMRVWDADQPADGSSTLRFDADEFAKPRLGTIVENSLVQHALLETLPDSRFELRFATRMESVEVADGGHRLALDTGEEIAADLLIAADGGRSPVREALGIGVTRLAYTQTAFVTHVTPEQPHRETAWQRFLPTGPIGLLPLADGRVSVVWSTTPDLAAAAMDDDDAALADKLSHASDHVLGRLTPAGPRGTFPLAAQHAERYVGEGVALVGDAAHTIHPLAGQGANLGFADAKSLVDTIERALDAGEFPADRPVLRRYERERRGANAVMMHALTGLNRLFASHSPVVGQARRTGMQLFNRAGPVRRRIVEVAFGADR
ncbi:MAG: UbiH/UbiF/VisC/COQ6 family ubiquinone biosynthesis hydroxylase [Pseudomonadota bacterium]